jgi:hypothetical protein
VTEADVDIIELEALEGVLEALNDVLTRKEGIIDTRSNLEKLS